MWMETSKPATITLVALGAGLLLFQPSQPPTEGVEEQTTNKRNELFNCTSLEEITDLEWIASGWTKTVYKARLRGRQIALKTVNLGGHDIETCLARTEASNVAWCYRRISAKLLREFIILQELEHPNVLKVLGSCIPDMDGPVVIATELGKPFDSVALPKLSWEERVKVSLSVASLLHLLAHSPLGSLAAPDLKRKQFVLVDGQLKLADADDFGITEPKCQSHANCQHHPGEGGKKGDGLLCIEGTCRGHNEKANILRAGIDLINHLLPDSGPPELQPQVRDLLAAYRGKNGWDTARILEETQNLARESR